MGLRKRKPPGEQLATICNVKIRRGKRRPERIRAWKINGHTIALSPNMNGAIKAFRRDCKKGGSMMDVWSVEVIFGNVIGLGVE